MTAARLASSQRCRPGNLNRCLPNKQLFLGPLSYPAERGELALSLGSKKSETHGAGHCKVWRWLPLGNGNPLWQRRSTPPSRVHVPCKGRPALGTPFNMLETLSNMASQHSSRQSRTWSPKARCCRFRILDTPGPVQATSTERAIVWMLQKGSLIMPCGSSVWSLELQITFLIASRVVKGNRKRAKVTEEMQRMTTTDERRFRCQASMSAPPLVTSRGG